MTRKTKFGQNVFLVTENDKKTRSKGLIWRNMYVQNLRSNIKAFTFD